MNKETENKIIEYLENEKAKLKALLPEYLQNDFEDNSFISGGAIYSLYHDKPINDIDFFIESLELKIALESYFKRCDGLVTLTKGSQKVEIGTYKGNKLVITDNAITIGKYQIVLRDYGEANDVVNRFDFMHNMYYVKKRKFYTVAELYYLELDELRFNDNRARDIVGTIMRIPKFVERGFSINQNELAKMLLALNKAQFSKEELDILEGRTSNIQFSSGGI